LPTERLPPWCQDLKVRRGGKGRGQRRRWGSGRRRGWGSGRRQGRRKGGDESRPVARVGERAVGTVGAAAKVRNHGQGGDALGQPAGLIIYSGPADQRAERLEISPPNGWLPAAGPAQPVAAQPNRLLRSRSGNSCARVTAAAVGPSLGRWSGGRRWTSGGPPIERWPPLVAPTRNKCRVGRHNCHARAPRFLSFEGARAQRRSTGATAHWSSSRMPCRCQEGITRYVACVRPARALLIP
jgi:hypothetical protein